MKGKEFEKLGYTFIVGFFLESASTDKEIKMKLDNKIKKAYRSLENVNKYIDVNDAYNFTSKNKDISINGKTNDVELLCIHVSMYSFDFVSSNIHTLDEEYRNIHNRISILFKHFLAILIDSFKKEKSLINYFNQYMRGIV